MRVDTSNNVIYLEPLRISNFADDAYVHEITYTVYLSKEFK